MFVCVSGVQSLCICVCECEYVGTVSERVTIVTIRGVLSPSLPVCVQMCLCGCVGLPVCVCLCGCVYVGAVVCVVECVVCVYGVCVCMCVCV